MSTNNAQHGNLYIVDNSTDVFSVKKYLSEWCSISKQMDIATGYLEIGGLLALDGEWQKLDKIRIILKKPFCVTHSYFQVGKRQGVSKH